MATKSSMSTHSASMLQAKHPAYSSSTGTRGCLRRTSKRSRTTASILSGYPWDVGQAWSKDIARTDKETDWAYTNSPPYVSGAAPYIDKAIGWARATGLKVWIDLHGAPGSQNGFDNSGHNGTVGWGTGSTVSDTLTVLQMIINKYAQQQYQDVVVGIELLNEPLTNKINGGFDTVSSFYSQGYADVRKVSNTPVIIQDGFNNASMWNGVLSAPKAQDVVLDHHEYQCFTQALIDLSPEVCLASIKPFVGAIHTDQHQGTRHTSLHQRSVLCFQQRSLGGSW